MTDDVSKPEFPLWRAALISFGLAGFLFVFRPFGLTIDNWMDALAVIGFAPLNFVAIVAAHHAKRPPILEHAAANAVFIIAANLVYVLFWSSGASFVPTLLQVTLVAGLTIGAIVLWNRHRYLKREVLELRSHQASVPRTTVVLKGENTGEILRLPAESILYAQARGNYVEVHYLSGGEERSALLRATLGAVAEQAPTALLQPCHRSFLVNIQCAERLVSDRDGMRLQFSTGSVVPISRRYRSVIREGVGDGGAVRP